MPILTGRSGRVNGPEPSGCCLLYLARCLERLVALRLMCLNRR
jgi:hypothetical protein